MNLKDFASLDTIKHLGKLDKDDLLEVLGLQTKTSAADYIIPGMLIFGAGLAVGCGLGLLLAPRPGAELRSQLGEAFNKGLEQGKQKIAETQQKVQQPGVGV